MSLITERALLVDFTARVWEAKKAESKPGSEYARNHGSDTRSYGKTPKYLIPPEALAKLKSIASAAYQDHKSRTLPWMDGGQRIMAAVGYMEYAKRQREYRDEFIAERDTVFVPNYPGYVSEGLRRLNGDGNPSDYPSERDIAGKFAIGTQVFPVPDANDFRVDLDRDTVAGLRARIEEEVESTVQASMRAAYGRVQEVVAKMLERLDGYQVTLQGVKNPFRDTLVRNIQDLVDVMPSLNITGDRQLDLLAQRVQQDLCRYTAEDLRTDERLRKDTAQKAQDILITMQDYL